MQRQDIQRSTKPIVSLHANITASGYSTSHISEYIIIADENGILVQVTEGNTATRTWPTCGIFTAYSYNYITVLTEPMVGDDVNAMLTSCNIRKLL